MKRVVSPLRMPSCTTTTTTTTSNNNNTTTTSQNTTTARWARRRVPSKDHTGMTCVDMEMEPLTQDQDEDTLSSTPTTSHRKGTSDVKELVQTLFDCIDNNKVEELRDLCGKCKFMKWTLHTPPAETPLHRVARKGLVDCLTVLLETRSAEEDLETPDGEGNTALLTAVTNAQPKALQQLLDAGANVNARDNKHRGTLHLLVLALSKGQEHVHYLNMVNLLFSPTQVVKLDLEPHTNFPDLYNATPLAVAAAKLQQGGEAPWIHSLLELCKKLIEAGASLSEKVGNITVKQVFTKMEYLLTELQQERQPPQRPVVAHVVDVVAMGGNRNDMTQVLQDRSKELCFEAVNSRIGNYSLLFHAVDIRNASLVEVLLEYGANPWEQEETLDLPLHHAAEENNKEIFKLITNKMKKDEKYLYLGGYRVGLFALCVKMGKNGQEANFRHLVQECDPKMTAATLNEDVMIEKVLPTLVFYLKELSNKDYDTVLDLVLPTSLKCAMDDHITLSEKDDTVKLDYSFLLPWDESGHVNELELSMRLCHNHQHSEAIKHPLMQTLLSAKYQKTKKLSYAWVFWYFVFTILFTYLCYRRNLFAAWWIFMLLIVELFRYCILWNFRRPYHLFVGAGKMLFMASILVPIFTQHECRVLSIIFVWYDFVMVLGRFSSFNKYATALHIVTETYIWLIFVYGGLIAAFASSFLIILEPSGNSTISEFGDALVTTFVMSIGEFGYPNFGESKKLVGISANILFIGFLFFIVLVIMNVMNSLAVNDIAESVKKAEFQKLEAELETLYTMERFFIIVSYLCPKVNCIHVFVTKNQSYLKPMICLSDKPEQLRPVVQHSSSKSNDVISTLDDNTLQCLRNYRTQQMQHK